MRRFFEKWYVLFMMIRIAKHNSMRKKFIEKYEDVFEAAGEDLEHMTLEKYYEKDKALYRRDKAGKEHKISFQPQEDDFGLYEYVDQRTGYCEDDYYGTIWTKTPFRNRWLERSFHC